MGLKYEPSLDGLRAVAVTMVVLHHSHVPGFAGGGRGVDVFFVLSGYLITSLLIERPVGLADFWRRRAVRLMPALLLMLATYVALAPIFIPADTSIRWRDAGMAALYMFNFVQAFENHETALGHLWSLAVEAQFYLVWPLLLPWFCRRRRPAAWLVGSWAGLTVLRMTMLTVMAAPHVAYNLTPPHASGLMLGAALVFLQPRQLGVLGLAGIIAACLLPTWGPLLSGGISLAELASAALILTLKGAPSTVSRWLSWSPMVTLGVLSYGVYLWHSVILHAVLDWPILPRVTITIVLSVGAAWASHRTVETWAKARFRQGSLRSAA